MPDDQDRKNWNHAMADIEPGLRLHYVTAGAGERTMVLLHGFPQTWWEWRGVIPALADDGQLGSKSPRTWSSGSNSVALRSATVAQTVVTTDLYLN